MADLVSSLAHRVDAARQAMSVPSQAAAASGRLFMAKRAHEAAKAGTLTREKLAAIEAELLAGLGAAPGTGVVAEAATIRSIMADRV